MKNGYERIKGRTNYFWSWSNGKRYGPYYGKGFVHKYNCCNASGVWREMSAKTYADWEQKRIKHFAEARNKVSKQVLDYSKATLKEMSVQFLEAKKQETKQSNYGRIKVRWDRHILPYFKNKVVSKITTEDTERFAKQITKNHGALECREVFVVLRTYFNWDLENEKCLFRIPISQGLRKSIENNRKKAQRKKGKVSIKSSDMDSIFFNAKYRDDEIVYHWLARGLRIGETLGVRVKDVDLARGKVYLSNQIQQAPKNENGSSTYQSETLKTERSHRPIDLNFFCSTSKLSAIKPLLAELMKDKQPDDLIYTTRNGTPCTPNNFRKRHLDLMLYNLSLEDSKITAQVFRQYFFAKGVSSGIDSALLSRAMGHTNISTTMRYYFPDIEDEDKPEEEKAKVIKLSEYDPIGAFLSNTVTQSI